MKCPYCPVNGPCPPISKKTQFITSAFKRGLEGKKRWYFSARYNTIEPDSNRLIGWLSPGPSLSSKAGILEFGLTETNPEVNWSPLPILITIIGINQSF